MGKVNLSELPFSKFTKIWLFVYIAFNFIWGIYSICKFEMLLPCILFALINIIAVTLIFKMKKQSFYLILSELIISIIFAFFIAKNWDGFSRLLVLIDYAFKLITWISIRNHYTEFKA